MFTYNVVLTGVLPVYISILDSRKDRAGVVPLARAIVKFLISTFRKPPRVVLVVEALEGTAGI